MLQGKEDTDGGDGGNKDNAPRMRRTLRDASAGIKVGS